MAVEFAVIESAFAQAHVEAPCLSGWKRNGKRQFTHTLQEVTHRIELIRLKGSFSGNQIVAVRGRVSFPCPKEPVYPANADEYHNGVASGVGYLTIEGKVIASPAFNGGAVFMLKSDADVASWALDLGERVCGSLVPWLEERGTAVMASSRCIESGSPPDILHIVLSFQGPETARERLIQYLASCISFPDSRPRAELFAWAAKHGLIDTEKVTALARAVIQARDVYVSELKRLVGELSRPGSSNASFPRAN